MTEEIFFLCLERLKKERGALRYIISFIDELLYRGEFSTCDRLLERLNPEELTVTCALAPLAITLQAKKHLKERSTYYSRVEEWLKKVRPEDLEKLLVGLG